jgi:dTDP-4-amino-4,6-dideoxygalactose transaminase
MIKTFEYQRSLAPLEDEVMEAVRRVLHSGTLILGPETRAFEAEFAACVGANYAIGVHSGTTAIELALMGLGIGVGDEVITVSNTCTPTVSAIERTGAQAIFVDVNESDLLLSPSLLEAAISEKTRAVVAVHLWGQAADLAAIKAVTDKHGLCLIEDCAQAQGTEYEGKHVGTFGHVACFSFYPTKNLGAYGDAGAVVTNDKELAERIARMRMYGYSRANFAQEKGMNGRIAEMQAAILRVKLPHLESWIQRRREIAERYHQEIQHPSIQLPFLQPYSRHAYHQFVIRCQNRQAVIDALNAAEISYGIHYETAIHQMPAYQAPVYQRNPLPVTEKAAHEILSIPLHEAMFEQEIEAVIKTLKEMP